MNRIFSGVQPTGNLHLGNYLGAIRNWVALQHDFECIFCIVDLHALTLPQDPAELRAIDPRGGRRLHRRRDRPERCTIFNQSMVSAHAELAWLLACLTPLGWLNRMTQFKEKAGKQREMAGLGLYAYPVLMAADILVYKATHVPVGEDQKQHLELARDIAGAFNRRYERDFFPLPEPQIFGAATRVMSLRDGMKKMSKSDTSDYSRINMTDDAEAIALKIRRAKTDPEPLPETIEALEQPARGRQPRRHLRGAGRPHPRSRRSPASPAAIFPSSRRRWPRSRSRCWAASAAKCAGCMADPLYIDAGAAPRRRARPCDRRPGAARGAADQRTAASLDSRLIGC